MSKGAESMAVTGVTTCVRVETGIDSARFTTWLVDLLMTGAESPGFVSGEIKPPRDAGSGDWTIIQTFRVGEEARLWQESQAREALLSSLTQVAGDKATVLAESVAPQEIKGGIATAIVTELKPGMESAYRNWWRKIQSAQAQFPGYGGIYVQVPPPNGKGPWTTLLRFDTPEQLEAWFASPQRLDLVEEAAQFVNTTKFQQLTSSFPGWFPTDDRTGEPPRKWKTAMLILVSVYPMVMLQRRFLYPHFAHLGPAPATLLGITLSVCIVTWVLMPFLVRTFNWWLLPRGPSRARIDAAGALIVLLCLTAELAALWNILPAH